MRRNGRVETASGLGLKGHACWVYASDDEFQAGARAFFEDGIALGQRLLYVGAGGVEKLRSDLIGLPDLDGLLGEGALRIMPLESAYELGRAVDPMSQLAMYSAATQLALADGYNGLRVVGEVTALVLDPALWRAHTHWESVADRYMTKNPMAALCCYDRRQLPDEILSDLACVHRASNGPAAVAPFRLFAGREGLSLAGEVDAFSADDLRRLLTLAAPVEGDIVLELDELEFIDHRGLLAVADFADALRRDGRRIRLLGAPPTFDRLTGILDVEL